MIWPFDTEYMQVALVGGAIVAFFSPVVGAFLVQKRLSLFGDGIGHIAFAGVAAGLAANVWPVWTAFLAAAIGAVGIEALRTSRRASADLILAVFFYGGIAIGVIIVSASSSFNASILSYLFGSILTVNKTDVVILAITGATVLITMFLIRRAMFAVVIDEEVARVAGLPVKRLNYILSIVAAVTVVAAMQVVGLLLVAALLVLPVAISQQISGSFWSSVRLSMLIGVLAVVIGLGAARSADIAPGGTIVMVLILGFVVASIIGSFARGRTHRLSVDSH